MSWPAVLFLLENCEWSENGRAIAGSLARLCINGSIELALKGLVRCAGVQEEGVAGAYLREVEHLRDGAGDGVEGALPNALSGEPAREGFASTRHALKTGDSVVGRQGLLNRRTCFSST